MHRFSFFKLTLRYFVRASVITWTIGALMSLLLYITFINRVLNYSLIETKLDNISAENDETFASVTTFLQSSKMPINFNSSSISSVTTQLSKKRCRNDFFVLGHRFLETFYFFSCILEHPYIYQSGNLKRKADNVIFSGTTRQDDTQINVYNNISDFVGYYTLSNLIDYILPLFQGCNSQKILILLPDPISICLSQFSRQEELNTENSELFYRISNTIHNEITKLNVILYGKPDVSTRQDLHLNFPKTKLTGNCFYELAYVIHILRLFETGVHASNVKIYFTNDLRNPSKRADIFKDALKFIGGNGLRLNEAMLKPTFKFGVETPHALNKGMLLSLEKEIRALMKPYDIALSKILNISLPWIEIHIDSANVPKIPRLIWMLWDKGWQNAPKLQRHCLESWENLNSDYKLIALDLKDAEFIINRRKYYSDEAWNTAIIQHKADIIRVELLALYGGIWVDATLQCIEPLSNWINNIVESVDFFVFERRDFNIKVTVIPHISNWFIAATNSSYMLLRWRDEIRKMWAREPYPSKMHGYLCHHAIFCNLTLNDNMFQNEYKKMPFMDAAAPRCFTKDKTQIIKMSAKRCRSQFKA